MKSLKESLFDGDLIKKYPVDLSFLKTTKKQEKVDIFTTLISMTIPPFNLEEHLDELYHENKAGFDFVLSRIKELERKQGFSSWFDIDAREFEERGDEMTDEEIDQANEELLDFFSNAYETETSGRFLIGKGKLPSFLVKIFKETGYWNPKMISIDTWAIDYWGDGPSILFYGCPRGLDPEIKKLLYNI